MTNAKKKMEFGARDGWRLDDVLLKQRGQVEASYRK